MKMKDLIISVFRTGKIPMHTPNSNNRFWVYADLKGNNVMIQPYKFLRIPIGFKAKMPSTWIGMAFIAPHLRFEKNLELASSLMETSEGDEWAIYVYNDSNSTQILEHGEKVAQIVFLKARDCKMLPFMNNDEGEKSFGIAGNPETEA